MPVFNIFEPANGDAEKVWLPADQIFAIYENSGITNVVSYSSNGTVDLDVLESFQDAVDSTKQELKELFKTRFLLPDE